MGMSYINPVSLLFGYTAEVLVAITALMHLAGVLAFGLLVFKLVDSPYVLAAKGLCAVLIFPFVLLAFFGFEAQAPRLLCTAPFSLFEDLSLMIIADIASCTTAAGMACGMEDAAVGVGQAPSAFGVVLAARRLSQRSARSLSRTSTGSSGATASARLRQACLSHEQDRRAPYYAARFAEQGSHTMDGLIIDEDMRVLGKDMEPIPGLCAAGDNSGGYLGVTYLGVAPGNAAGRSVTFGRHAGRVAALS